MPRHITPTAAPTADPPGCERLWSIGEVADFLGIPVATLHQWRYLGSGPEAFRVGKHLRYDPDIVRRWLVESCQRSTTGKRI